MKPWVLVVILSCVLAAVPMVVCAGVLGAMVVLPVVTPRPDGGFEACRNCGNVQIRIRGASCKVCGERIR